MRSHLRPRRHRLAATFVPLGLLAVACSSATSSSLSGERTNQANAALLATSRVVNATTGDFNRDGMADFADDSIVSGQFAVHLNNWTGGFLTSSYETVQRAVSGPNWDTLVGDFNDDGLVDYADHAQDSGKFWIHLNQFPAPGKTTGTFSSANFSAGGGSLPSGTTATGAGWEVLVADFTGDGWCDYADHDLASGNIWVHQNMHDGTFGAQAWNPDTYPDAEPVANTTTTPGWDVLVGDFNNDKFADYAEHQQSSGLFYVYVNNKDGTFSHSVFAQGKTATGPTWEVLIADFNGDGYADFADRGIDGGQFWVHLNMKTPTSFKGLTFPVAFNTASWATGATQYGSGKGVLGHEWHGGSGDACGDLDEPYCQTANPFTQACKPGLWFPASSSLCVACGAQNQSPCTGYADYSSGAGVWMGTCNAGLDNVDSPPGSSEPTATCQPCGAAGQPSCVHRGCNAGLGSANNGICEPCGAAGEYACAGKCNAGLNLWGDDICGVGSEPAQGQDPPAPSTSLYTFCCLPLINSGLAKYEVSALGTSQSDAANKLHHACHGPNGTVGDPLFGKCSTFTTVSGQASCQESSAGFRWKCCAKSCTSIGACSDGDETTATNGFDATCSWQDDECPASCH